VFVQKILYALILLITVAFCSCSKTEGPAAPSNRPADNAAPEVTVAAVFPEQPTSDKALTIEFTAKDREGDPMQFTFRWYVDNSLVQDSPGQTLEPGKYTRGSEVYAEVIAADSYSPGNPFRTKTVTVINQPPVITAVALSPVGPAPGALLTATPAATDPDGDDIKYSYQWKVNGKAVTEPQESNTFDTKGLRKKDMVFAVVTPTDRKLEGKPMDSEIVVLANSGPQITSTPPTGLANGVYLYQVTAKDPDGDRLTYSLLKSPQGMTIDPSTGLIRWEPPKEVQGKSDVPIKISVDDGDGGKALQEYSLTLEMK
jgi:Putative Ig domain